MKEEERRPIKTFSVQTNAGKVEKVPVTIWKDLVPYWESICRAIFEVLIEDDFKPYTATLKRPKGFVASNSYWRLSLKNPKRFPLSEAHFFMYKLLEKPYFTNSIKEFNKKIQKNWLEEKNIAILGGYIYSFYYTLRPVLEVVGEGTKASRGVHNSISLTFWCTILLATSFRMAEKTQQTDKKRNCAHP